LRSAFFSFPVLPSCPHTSPVRVASSPVLRARWAGSQLPHQTLITPAPCPRRRDALCRRHRAADVKACPSPSRPPLPYPPRRARALPLHRRVRPRDCHTPWPEVRVPYPLPPRDRLRSVLLGGPHPTPPLDARVHAVDFACLTSPLPPYLLRQVSFSTQALVPPVHRPSTQLPPRRMRSTPAAPLQLLPCPSPRPPHALLGQWSLIFCAQLSPRGSVTG
jgi:hypothetical protein